jgi:class 3 adenylate cyclase
VRLEILVMRVIQVTQLLLDFGYLVRGAIEVGKVWHVDANIVGPAYQEAYRLEPTAKMPRVILSAPATQLWRSSGESAGNRMCALTTQHSTSSTACTTTTFLRALEEIYRRRSIATQ